MAQFTIAAKVRNETGKKAAKAIRAAGNIPAVVYDEAGKATSITVNSVEFNKVWRNITKTTLVTLDVDGKSCDAFISDVEQKVELVNKIPGGFTEVSVLGEKGAAGEPYKDYVMVATTRPETLPGDTAVAVNPKARYRA